MSTIFSDVVWIIATLSFTYSLDKWKLYSAIWCDVQDGSKVSCLSFFIKHQNIWKINFINFNLNSSSNMIKRNYFFRMLSARASTNLCSFFDRKQFLIHVVDPETPILIWRRPTLSILINFKWRVLRYRHSAVEFEELRYRTRMR